MEQLESNPDHKATIHQKLEPLRELVLTAPDLNAAVRRIIQAEGDGQQAAGEWAIELKGAMPVSLDLLLH